jgi:hypothetical protein
MYKTGPLLRPFGGFGLLAHCKSGLSESVEKNRPMRATAIAALVFSAFMLGNRAPRLTSLGRPSEQTGFGPLNVCTGAAGSAGVQSDLMRDGIEVAT